MQKENIIIWGASPKAEKYVHELIEYCDVNILGFIDNDIVKQNTLFCEKIVFSPDILIENIFFDKIIVLSFHIDDIKRQIISYGISEDKVDDERYLYKCIIMKRYASSTDKEIIDILKYLKENRLQNFNYEFTKKYEKQAIEIFYDDYENMHYVIHSGKRMYFPKSYKKEKIEQYYRSILMEQDIDSPHRYVDDEFCVSNNSVVVDAGAAEGFFSLEIIDFAKHLYIVEKDPDWLQALKITFKQYSDKVTILEYFIDSISSKGYIRKLDDLIHERIDFIKMDIEGYEWDALIGAERIINESPNIKCCICTYHTDYDEVVIRNQLEKYGLKCETTKGYMWYGGLPKTNYISTKLVRGVIRGEK